MTVYIYLMKKNKLNNIVIGNGYIGKYLKKKFKINKIYNSKNISDIRNGIFNIIFLAAPSSKKFLANMNPYKDSTNIKNLIEILKTIKCKKVICISSVDTFNNFSSNEKSKIDKKKLSYYGRNRLFLNNFIKTKFKNYLIIKLPSLFGNNEKKGFFYDLTKFKNIHFYNEKTELQWYYTPYLARDIIKLKEKRINEINLVSEPISCGLIARELNLVRLFNNNISVIKYNINTIHNFKNIKYSYSKDRILRLMKNYFKN